MVSVKVILQLRICTVAKYIKLFFLTACHVAHLSDSVKVGLMKHSLQINCALINCNINLHFTCSVTGCENVKD